MCFVLFLPFCSRRAVSKMYGFGFHIYLWLSYVSWERRGKGSGRLWLWMQVG